MLDNELLKHFRRIYNERLPVSGGQPLTSAIIGALCPNAIPLTSHDWFEYVCAGVGWNSLPTVYERAHIIVETVLIETSAQIPTVDGFPEFMQYCHEVLVFFDRLQPNVQLVQELLADIVEKSKNGAMSPFFDAFSAQISQRPYLNTSQRLDYVVAVMQVYFGNSLVDRKLAAILLSSMLVYNSRYASDSQYLVDLTFANRDMFELMMFCNRVKEGLDE